MASQPNTGGAAALPLSLIAQAVPKLSRHDLEALTERLIDALDFLDGDPDLEDSDDDTAADDWPCDEDFDHEPEDYGDEFADPAVRVEHRQRIRRERCTPQWSRYSVAGRPQIVGYRLFREPQVPTKRQLFRRKRGVPRLPRA